MLKFDRFILENGLKVIVHQDTSTPIVAVNILYNVGSKHEDSNMTGFAHLFEHLMFGGSINIPVYDEPVDRACGENNAFTSNDITNYYLSLPKENIETAFWLESDRMLSLAFSQKSLDVQKSVVIEEFNQRYLNQPYGDVWLLLRPLAYKVHPYQWPTIGKSIQHISDANLEDVKEFFYSHYAPNNAILCVAGNLTTPEVKELVTKWFGPIPRRNLKTCNIIKEPIQLEQRRLEVTRKVPYNAIYIAFHMCSRIHPDYAITDLITDILSNGKSSRLFQNLVKKQSLFSNIDAFISGDIDEGLIIITGQLSEGISFQVAEEAIFNELDQLKTKAIDQYELDKVKNKFESTFTFGLTNATEKAINLCYNELLGDADLINQTIDSYNKVAADDIMRVASKIFVKENSSILHYIAEKNGN
jgi:predicted Zn-dependent peptidase